MRLLIHHYEEELRSLAEEAVEIRILIAFMTEVGLSWLPDDRIPLSECIVGTGLGITTPDAIRKLMNGGGTVWVFQDPSRLFHPKALYFRTADREYLIVGSNNLTSAGISSNYELSTLAIRCPGNTSAFDDFLAHFENLKRDACCQRPNEQFFSDYRPSQIPAELKEKMATQEIVRISAEEPIPGSREFEQEDSVGGYLRLIARDFPVVKEATRKGSTIAEHPLKKLNEDHFIDRLQKLVQQASSGRLTALSSLNQGGNWRKIPLISASDDLREPWERTSKDGRLVLQVHYGEDFQTVSISLVIQYTVVLANKEGIMPKATLERFERVKDRLKRYSAGATIGGESFKIFDYPKENVSAWARPILSHSYEINSLPSDVALEQAIESLASALNEGAFVR
jgi:hypothetical protein